jgi:hypothetical protein
VTIPATNPIQFHGRTAGASAVSGPCGGAGPEAVFRFTPQTNSCYEFSTCGTTFDSQLSIGDGPPVCPGPNGPQFESCFDDNQPCDDGSARELVFGIFQAGVPLTIVLDGTGASQAGSYTLDARPSGRCLF